jgi:hypothetical protein
VGWYQSAQFGNFLSPQANSCPPRLPYKLFSCACAISWGII